MAEAKPKSGSKTLLLGKGYGRADARSGSGLRGCLTIRIVKAENLLLPGRALHCDPYCSIRVAGSKPLKTTARKRTLQPTWNEEFVFEDVVNVDNVHIKIKDLSRWQAKGLAEAKLNLHPFIDGVEHDMWIDLSPQGRLRVVVTFEDVSQLFGLPIGDVCLREGRDIPWVVSKCVEEIERRGLKETGLYRVSGNVQLVNELRARFNDDPAHTQLDTAVVPNISSVAALLKLYFRELPEPLFTSALYPSFIAAALATTTDEVRRRFFVGAIRALPKANYDAALFLFDHLMHVLQHSSSNMMSAANLATCFGPTLFTPAENDAVAMKSYNVLGQNSIVQFLLDNWPAIRRDLSAAGSDSGLSMPPVAGLSLSSASSMEASLEHSPAGQQQEMQVQPATVSAQQQQQVAAAPVTPTPAIVSPVAQQPNHVSNGPLPSPTADPVQLQLAFARFDQGGRGVLEPAQFRLLCELMGVSDVVVEEAVANGANRTFSDFSLAVSRDALNQSQQTARARAKSVNHLTRRWESKTKRKSDPLALPARCLMGFMHDPSDKLDCAAFRQLTYALGFPTTETDYQTLHRDASGKITVAQFDEWFERTCRPQLSDVYSSKAKCTLLQAVVSEFQRLDPALSGEITAAAATRLQSTLAALGHRIDVAAAVAQDAANLSLVKLLVWMVNEDLFEPPPPSDTTSQSSQSSAALV
eukprot:m.119930 g.119930  ORF g.119930 m.119930 type:complete len:697 (+) comp16165_c1_seq1:111-2201(+)